MKLEKMLIAPPTAAQLEVLNILGKVVASNLVVTKTKVLEVYKSAS